MTASIVVKIQVPLATNDPQGKALVYDKNRQYFFQTTVTPEIRKFMGDESKKFCFLKVSYVGDEMQSQLCLEQANNQNW